MATAAAPRTEERPFLEQLQDEQGPYTPTPAGLYRLSDVPLRPWISSTRRFDKWMPLPRQRLVLYSPVRELFFGGSRGPGKTDTLIADFVCHEMKHGGEANGILFRRTQPEFAQVHRKCQTMLRGRARWVEKDGIWHFPSGAMLRLAYLDAFRHVGRYQGMEYTWIGFDELTEWADPAPYQYMFSCLRNTGDFLGVIRSSGNPGRPGHEWVRARFVAVRNEEEPWHPFRDPETGIERIFIDAILEDNPYLWKNEPDYDKNLLAMSPDRNTYEAQRFGRWDVFVGQALHEWDPNMHIMAPIRLDPRWPRWAAIDWGTKRPYAMLYFTRTPDGHIYQWRERYGIERGDFGEIRPNIGSRENAYQVASEEWRFAQQNNVFDVVYDPDLEKDIGLGDTVAGQFRKVGFNMHVADNRRVPGKQAVHKWLGTIMRDGYPMFRIFSTCEHTIRTLPTLVYNSRIGDEEDVDKEGETHAYDAVRYSAMSRFADDSEIRALRGTMPGSGGLSRDERLMHDWNVNDPTHVWGNGGFLS